MVGESVYLMGKFWGKKIMPSFSKKDQRDAGNFLTRKFNDLTTIKGKRNATTKPEIGKLYTYQYKAKWDKLLPTWDRQPLMMCVNLYNDGFLGLNFHYLKITDRYRLLSALMEVATPLSIQALQQFKRDGFLPDLENQLSGNPDDTDKRLILTWQIVKSVASSKYYKPTVKRYLYSQLQTPLSMIPSREWKLVLPLPTHRWVRGKPY